MADGDDGNNDAPANNDIVIPPVDNNAQPLPPQVNQAVHAMQPLKLLKYLRKYDGKSDSREFMSRLESDLDDHDVSPAWITNNFDRVLEGEAQAWYISVRPDYTHQMQRENAAHAFIWSDLKQEFLKFFDHSSLVNTHKQTNRKLKFEVGDDPQSYVTAKLEVLRYIDPEMSNSRKVENLVKGLPLPLQVQMITCDTNSPREFIDQLRKIAELFNRNGIVNEKTLTQATNSLYSAPMLAEVQVRRKESRSTQETNNNVRTTNNNNRNIVCYYCHIPNHIIRNCNNKIRDEERGIFQTSRPSPSNNQGRNQTQQGRTFVNSSQNQYNGRNFSNNTYPSNNAYNNQQQWRPQQLNNNGQQWRSQQQQQWRPQQWNNNGQQQQQFNQQQQQQLSPPNNNMNPMPLMGMNVDPMYNPQTTFQNQNSSDLN